MSDPPSGSPRQRSRRADAQLEDREERLRLPAASAHTPPNGRDSAAVLPAILEELRRARAEAEAARQRLEFLAEASRVLSSVSDPDTTPEQVARLVVPTFADWCLVHRVGEDGAARVV